jgi:hypothetical protein
MPAFAGMTPRISQRYGAIYFHLRNSPILASLQRAEQIFSWTISTLCGCWQKGAKNDEKTAFNWTAQDLPKCYEPDFSGKNGQAKTL